MVKTTEARASEAPNQCSCGLKTERGASMVEYALLLGLITILALVAVRVMGQTVSKQFSLTSSLMS